MEGGRYEFKYRTLFVDIIFHARIFYSVNRHFYIISQLALFKKRGPAFPILLPPPPFSSHPPRLSTSPIIRYQCLVLLRTNPQTMPTGPAPRLTLWPTTVSTPFSIPVCFRSQARPAYRPLERVLTGDATESPPKRGRGRPKGSKNKKSVSSTADATGEEAPKRKRGRPPKVRIILISSACRVPSSHHSSFPHSHSHTHRERRRMREQIPHPSANVVVLPRIPSRRPMKTPITSNLLNLAPRPRRRGRVGPARARAIDTTYLSFFEAIMIAQERLIPHVQDSFVHNIEQHTP